MNNTELTTRLLTKSLSLLKEVKKYTGAHSFTCGRMLDKDNSCTCGFESLRRTISEFLNLLGE